MANDFFNNLFGTIAGGAPQIGAPSSIGFIPNGINSETIRLKGDSPLWMGMRNVMMQKYAYEYCYPISAIINKLAEYDLTGNVEILRTYGQKANDYATTPWAMRMKNLLARPNPLQTWEQFRGEQIIYKKLFGYCPVYPLVPEGFTPDYATAMINIPPWLFEAVSANGVIISSDIKDLVRYYRATIFGKTITLEPNQIFILEDSYMKDEDTEFILPKSRLVGLDMAISNICAAMEADSVLLRKKGPLGFISHDAVTKDSVAGYIPMSKDQKKELQQDLTQYGLSFTQFQYVISKVAARWNPMSYDVKQLGTKETVVAGEKAICAVLNYSHVLYEQSNTTYANGDNALSDLYTSNVVPNSNKDMNKYNQYFRAEENRAKITADFSHVAALQEDRLNESNANKVDSDRLAVEFNNNLITLNEWRTARGYDTMPSGDVYKKDMTSNVEQSKPLNNENPPS